MSAQTFEAELVALNTKYGYQLNAAIRCRCLLVVAIALMDVAKVQQGHGLSTLAELEGFLRLVFASLRAQGGSTPATPKGGVQA